MHLFLDSFQLFITQSAKKSEKKGKIKKRFIIIALLLSFLFAVIVHFAIVAGFCVRSCADVVVNIVNALNVAVDIVVDVAQVGAVSVACGWH